MKLLFKNYLTITYRSKFQFFKNCEARGKKYDFIKKKCVCTFCKNIKRGVEKGQKQKKGSLMRHLLVLATKEFYKYNLHLRLYQTENLIVSLNYTSVCTLDRNLNLLCLKLTHKFETSRVEKVTKYLFFNNQPVSKQLASDVENKQLVGLRQFRGISNLEKKQNTFIQKLRCLLVLIFFENLCA